LLLFFGWIISFNTLAQGFAEKEVELRKYIPVILKSKTENDRIEAAMIFNKEFKKVLETPESYQYNFDSLSNVSKAFSTDGKVKVYTFLVLLDNGTYKYFGFVQTLWGKKSTVQLVELYDHKEEIKNFPQALINHRKWSGAIYYQCVTTIYKRKTYYTLLAWEGNTNLINRKIIEPLQVNKHGEVKFGDNLFTDEVNKRNRRVIFDYSKQASMSLKYYSETMDIVFDHLSPPEPQLTGQYQFYGPDFSYDAYRFSKGKWNLVTDVLPRNTKDNEKPFKRPEKVKTDKLYKPK